MARAARGAPAPLRLVLPDAGGTVTGRVVDVDGRPLGGALVGVDHSTWDHQQRTAAGEWMRMPPAVWCRSDPDGRFAFSDLRPGAHAVLAFHPHRGTARAEVDVADGGEAFVQLPLVAAAALAGTVRDAAGQPLAGVEVEVDARDALHPTTAVSAADGTFHVAAVDPGTHVVRANGGDDGLAAQPLVFASGEVTRWDVRLAPGPCLEGVVVDERGTPLSHLMVGATGTGDWAATDARGRFVLRGREPRPHVLQVHDARRDSSCPAVLVEHAGAVPGVPQRVVVPDAAFRFARVVARVVDPAGRAAPFASLSVCHRGASLTGATAAADGLAVTEPLPPGRYDVHLDAHGWPPLSLRDVELQPGTDLDLGELRLQEPGQVELRLAGARPEEHPHLRVQVRDANGRLVAPCVLEPDLVRSGPLAPGDYRLCGEGHRFAAFVLPVRVAVGETTRVAIDLPRSVPCWLVVERAPSRAPGVAHVVVTDEGARAVFEGRGPEFDDEPAAFDVALAPGCYTASATVAGTVVASAAFVVHTASPGERDPRRILLR